MLVMDVQLHAVVDVVVFILILQENVHANALAKKHLTQVMKFQN